MRGRDSTLFETTLILLLSTVLIVCNSFGTALKVGFIAVASKTNNDEETDMGLALAGCAPRALWLPETAAAARPAWARAFAALPTAAEAAAVQQQCSPAV